MSRRIDRENLQLVDDLLKNAAEKGDVQVQTARIILARELDAPARKPAKAKGNAEPKAE